MAKTISVNGLEVGYKEINDNDYICLTDMAKFDDPNKTGYVITKWLSTRYTIEFMGIWERFNNPDFNVTEYGNIRNESGGQSYYLSQKQWIERTGAIGIIAKTGRYGGTYAHKDIAFEFATWLSAEFKYYIIAEFQRLKNDEQKHLQWSATRELAKVNYHTQTNAIKEHLIIPELTEKQKLYKYTDEADLLNVALFGHTAKEWRTANPEKAKSGNVRDFSNSKQLLILTQMETLNAELIKQKIGMEKRIEILNNTARQQLNVLMEVDNRLYLQLK